MKRTAKKIKRKAWRYEDMYPQFVSIVDRGANRVPFSLIKLSEDTQIEEGLDISKVVFSAGVTESYVKSFLDNRGITDYNLQKDAEGRFYVENENEFSDVKVISMDDGTDIYVGVTTASVVQEKTKIEAVEDVASFSEGGETDVIEDEQTAKLEDEAVDEVVDDVADETVEDASEVVEDTVDTETVEDVTVAAEDTEANTESKVEAEVEETTEVAMSENDTVTRALEAINVKLKEHNSYTEMFDKYKLYVMFDTVFYMFKDRVAEALESDEDKQGKVMYEANEFGKACYAIYNALSSVSLKEPEVKEETVELSEPEKVEESTNSDLAKFEELVNSLKAEVESLKEGIQKKESVDNTNLKMQTSKADVSVLDKSGLDSHTSQAQQPQTKTQKNLFGLI